MEKIKSALQLTLEAEGWEFFAIVPKSNSKPFEKYNHSDWLKYMRMNKLERERFEAEIQIQIIEDLKDIGIQEVKFKKAYNDEGNHLPGGYAVYIKR